MGTSAQTASRYGITAMKIYSIGFQGAIGRKRGIGLAWGGAPMFGVWPPPPRPSIPRGVFDPPVTCGYLDPDIGSGFPKGYQAPPLRYDPTLGGKPDDVTSWVRDTWLLSPRAKLVMEAIDAAAFAPVAMHWPAAKEAPAREETWWIAHVIRHLDALDFERTQVTITDFDNGRRSKRAKGIRGVTFVHDAVEGSHVFRQTFARNHINCNQTFVAVASEARLSGLMLSHEGDAL